MAVAQALSPAIEREIGQASNNCGLWGATYDDSEDAPELQWPLSVIVYDRMRRQDAQVAATLRALTLPIRRPIWKLDPNGAHPDVVALCSEDLDLPVLGENVEDRPRRPRAKGRFSWSEHIRLALLHLAYGHMAFEQVYRIVDGKARLRKLAPRMPRTLSKITTAADGGLESIQQYTAGPSATIGVDRLVWYANDREAAAWQGQSVLRSAYKHWMLKDRLMRVQAMTIERNGMGVPTIETGPGTQPTQLAEANRLAQGYRAGEYSGGALPPGMRLRLVGVEGSLPDALPAIRYHDEQVAGNVLAMFLKLGSTETGSRALGQSFIDFFSLALDAVADQIADVATQHIVEDIVDLNWGEDEPAPRVVFGEPDAPTDIQPEALVALVESGALSADEDLESYLRDKYRLPAHTGTTRTPPPAPVAAGRGRRPFVY